MRMVPPRWNVKLCGDAVARQVPCVEVELVEFDAADLAHERGSYVDDCREIRTTALAAVLLETAYYLAKDVGRETSKYVSLLAFGPVWFPSVPT